MVFARLVSLFVFLICLALPSHAEGQRVILVLDASGSMWGKIGGKAKIEIARETVAKVIPSFGPDDELGLVAYGHREKGSCTDIETVIEPSLFKADEFMAAVNALQPKGKTPMTQAVRQAAEALKYTEKQATIILVSDGLETCDPDPCAVASELERLGIGLTVHTVGFGLDDPKAVDQLKCLAEKTGGIAILAEDAEQLEEALKKTVQAANAPAAPVVEPEPEPEPVVEPSTYAVTVQPVLVTGVPLPDSYQRVFWSLSKAVDGVKADIITSNGSVVPKFDNLAAGEYAADFNNAQYVKTVFFKAGPGQPDVVEAVLDAAAVSFSGMMDESTQVSESANFTIHTPEGKHLATHFGTSGSDLLPTGTYKIILEDGAAKIEQAFSVEAGKTYDLVLTLGAGILKPIGTYSGKDDKLAEGAAYELRLPPDISGDKKHIATEYGNGKQFKAQAGDYIVVATLDYAKVEVPVKIIAGQAVEAQINLNAGFLAAKSPGAHSFVVFGGTPAIDGTRPNIGTTYGAEINVALNAGKYQLIVYIDSGEVVATKDIEIVAGQRLELTLP